jgi:uncharacterized protein YdhG (YjbR/CyaY superfamily)
MAASKTPTAGRKKYKSIAQYHLAYSGRTREQLEKLYQVIEETAKGAEEAISYNIPTFKLNGKNLVHYAAFREHIGFYPAPSAMKAFSAELKKYKTSKGAVQFPIDKRLPLGLIRKIVKFRVKETRQYLKPARKTIAKGKPAVHYHRDGTVWATGRMLDGKMHGFWEWFRKDGTIMRSGFFDRGKQADDWTTYDRKGKAVRVTNMNKDSR